MDLDAASHESNKSILRKAAVMGEELKKIKEDG